MGDKTNYLKRMFNPIEISLLMIPAQARDRGFPVKCPERDKLRAEVNPYASNCRIFRHLAEGANSRTNQSLCPLLDKDLEKAMGLRIGT
jgi:hypothetical protein